MRIAGLVLLACLGAGAAIAQTAPRLRAAPFAPVATPAPAAVETDAIKDYRALYEKEAQKNRELRSQVASLTERIAQITRPDGSLVQAYCESATLSRNTAGASNDCSVGGLTCEPVSGLCRTTAQSSLHCAIGFTYCSKYASCVRSADACQ